MIIRILKKAMDMVCPKATQDVALNTKNRNATRENHMYGPLNVEEPGDRTRVGVLVTAGCIILSATRHVLAIHGPLVVL